MALRSTAAALLALSAGCTCGSAASLPSASKLTWSPAAASHRLDFSQLSRSVLPDRSLKTRETQLQSRKEDQRNLVSRDSYTLEIHPDGSIKGSFNTNSKYGVLSFTYYMISIMLLGRSEDPIVQIKGKETGLWLCMNQDGELFTKFNGRNDEECQFRYKTLNNDYRVFYNNKYPLQTSNRRTEFFYIALRRRSGLPRSGVNRTHKSAQFLTLPVNRQSSQPKPLPTLLTSNTTSRPGSSRSGGSRRTRPTRTRARGMPRGDRQAAAPEDRLLSSFESVLADVSNTQNKKLITYSSGMTLPDPTFNMPNMSSELLRHARKKVGHRRKSKKNKGKRKYTRAKTQKRMHDRSES